MSCPVCGGAPEAKYRPFCSVRCADIDLGRWLTGSYRIEGDEDLAEGDGVTGAGLGLGPGAGSPGKALPGDGGDDDFPPPRRPGSARRN